MMKSSLCKIKTQDIQDMKEGQNKLTQDMKEGQDKLTQNINFVQDEMKEVLKGISAAQHIERGYARKAFYYGN